MADSYGEAFAAAYQEVAVKARREEKARWMMILDGIEPDSARWQLAVKLAGKGLPAAETLALLDRLDGAQGAA
jgi:hypothetical protein